MNRAEAEYLFIDKGELSVEDYYQECLFEYKKFFLQKAPIRKVFQAKLNKLDALNQAFSLLTSVHLGLTDEVEMVSFSTQVKETFDLYHQKRNEITQRISRADSGVEISNLVDSLLMLTEQYAYAWEIKNDDNVDVKVGTEPNPMDIFKAIGEFNDAGKYTFTEITELPKGNALVLESKRLTLLRKMI